MKKGNCPVTGKAHVYLLTSTSYKKGVHKMIFTCKDCGKKKEYNQ